MQLQHRRPPEVLIISAAYAVSPLLNLAQLARWSDPTWDGFWQFASHGVGLAWLSLTVAGPLTAVGIYSGHIWGFALFLAYSGAALAYNSSFLFTQHRNTVVSIILLNLCIFAVVFYMLRRDLRAPYLAQEQRGWRINRRVVCSVPVQLLCAGQELAAMTVNVSPTGVLISCPGGAPAIPGDALTLVLGNGADAPRMQGMVVWVGDQGSTMGIAFADATSPATKQLWALANA